MPDLRIECAYDKLVPLDAIKPHPKNVNRHSTEQVNVLAKIILQNGFRAPICISNRSGYVTRGHARYAAATLLGAKTVPVDFQDYGSEEEEVGDMLADNHIAELSERDPVLLRDILATFPKDQLDLTSYTEVDLKAMFPPELDMAEADLSERIETLDPKKPVMTHTWWLIGVPMDMVGRVQPQLAIIEKCAGITVKSNKIA
jgi:ParB-like chromosome segregation protein Spo0J